jgi:hypothetical protein
MATRYSGNVVVSIRWIESNKYPHLPHNGYYRCTLHMHGVGGQRLGVQFVGAPAHLTHAIDSEQAYDETARAALAFAIDADQVDDSDVAHTADGWYHTGRTRHDAWPKEHARAKEAASECACETCKTGPSIPTPTSHIHATPCPEPGKQAVAVAVAKEAGAAEPIEARAAAEKALKKHDVKLASFRLVYRGLDAQGHHYVAFPNGKDIGKYEVIVLPNQTRVIDFDTRKSTDYPFGAGEVAAESKPCAPEAGTSHDEAARCKTEAEKLGKLDEPWKIYELIGPSVSKEDQEVCGIVPLDPHLHLKGSPREVHRGGRARVEVDKPVILQRVVEEKASYYVLFHSHPSGKARPSKADEHLTEEMKRVSHEVGVPMLDHVVIGREQFYSFTEKAEYRRKGGKWVKQG